MHNVNVKIDGRFAARFLHRPELAGEKPDPGADFAPGLAHRPAEGSKSGAGAGGESNDHPKPEEKPLGGR